MTKEKLKETRKALGLSVKDAARIFKRTYSAWGKWERGERPVDELIVVALHLYSLIDRDKRPV
jgi:transcriptional regulator with XRE-family HTH domain